MDTLGNSEFFKAFYIACHNYQAATVIDTVLAVQPQFYLICAEYSKKSHFDVSGHHLHILATLSTKEYKAIVQRLIKQGLDLRGRAAKGLGRSYGLVRDIKDLTKMGAYTLKHHDPSHNLVTNFPDQIIKELKTISYVKEDQRDTHELLMEYIKYKLPKIQDQVLISKETYKNVPYQIDQLDTQIKMAIVEFFRKQPDLKFPTSHTMKYLATKYALQADIPSDIIVFYFFRW